MKILRAHKILIILTIIFLAIGAFALSILALKPQFGKPQAQDAGVAPTVADCGRPGGLICGTPTPIPTVILDTSVGVSETIIPTQPPVPSITITPASNNTPTVSPTTNNSPGSNTVLDGSPQVTQSSALMEAGFTGPVQFIMLLIPLLMITLALLLG